MKTRVKINIAIMSSIVAIGLLTTKVSASQIEIKPTAKGARSVTVSQSYVTCRNLDNVSSTLGTTALDPHLVTNKDWGAVAYLANSDYGVGAEGHSSSSQGKSGKEITIDSIKYYSTSGNATGVMNWGANPNETTYTQVASLTSCVTSLSQIQSEDIRNNMKTIVNNTETRYVERVNDSNTLGMALTEVNGWGINNWNRVSGSYPGNPAGIRCGFFGYKVGAYIQIECYGGSRTDTTFRPVIWNIN